MKEILIAVISFTVSAIIISVGMTMVGNVVAPDTLNIAASYDVTSSKALPEGRQDHPQTSEDKKAAVTTEGEKRAAITEETSPEEPNETLVALTETPPSTSSETTRDNVEPAHDTVISETNLSGASEAISDKVISQAVVPSEAETSQGQEKLAGSVPPSDSVPSTSEETVTEYSAESESVAKDGEEASDQGIEEETISSGEATDVADEEILEETVTPEPEVILEEPPVEEPDTEETVTPEPEVILEEPPVEKPKTQAIPHEIPTEFSQEKSETAPKDAPEKIKEVTITKEPEADAAQTVEIKEAVKSKTADEIKALVSSLENGEKLDLGDGRVAYKVKSGDTFSQICQKVIGTSTTWKEEAKKMKIDYRKIYPGMVLFFKSRD
jgi:hypothetical protein